MKNRLSRFIATIVPFLIAGISIVLLIIGIIIFSYILFFGAIIGLILFVIAYIYFALNKRKMSHLYHKTETYHKVRSGRIIDHDQDEEQRK